MIFQKRPVRAFHKKITLAIRGSPYRRDTFMSHDRSFGGTRVSHPGKGIGKGTHRDVLYTSSTSRFVVVTRARRPCVRDTGAWRRDVTRAPRRMDWMELIACRSNRRPTRVRDASTRRSIRWKERRRDRAREGAKDRTTERTTEGFVGRDWTDRTRDGSDRHRRRIDRRARKSERVNAR